MSNLKSPIDLLFKLGDKVTKGDPLKQQDFTYYMLWILFLAFMGMFLANTFRLFTTPFNADHLIWGVIGFAITSLQFFNLKSMYEMRKLRNIPQKEEKLESVEEMIESFNKNSITQKEVKTNDRKEKER